MNLIDQEMIVNTIAYMHGTGQLGAFDMVVEEDGTATLYPLGKWKDKIVLRVAVKDGLLQVLACSPKDWSYCGGEGARARKEAWELIGQYLELYGG